MNKGMNDMTNSIADICEVFASDLDNIIGRFKMEGMTREDMENIFLEIIAEAFDTED
jgi:hypothetical protein